jgi:hypothetical protein
MVSFGGNIISRIRRDSKGLSNVVVAMLSLVIVVIIVVNVVLWSYQMNQFDFERMHENLEITSVVHVNDSSVWFPTQSEFTVTPPGSVESGTYTDTQNIDGFYETFTKTNDSAPALDWWNPAYAYRRRVTITNNAVSTMVSGYSVSLTVDAASLTSAGKLLSNGNDLRVLYQSGSNWTQLDRTITGVNTSSAQIWFETQTPIPGGSSDDNYYLYYGNPNSGHPPANASNVYLWSDDFSRPDEPDITAETSYQVKTGGGTWSIQSGTLKNIGASGDPNKLIITALGSVNASIDMLAKINVASFAGGDTSRIGLSCCMDTNPSVGSGYCGLLHNDLNSLDFLNDLRSWGAHTGYTWSLNTWYCMRFRVLDPSSRLGELKIWPDGTPEPGDWTMSGSFGSGAARSYGEVGFAGSRTSDTTYFDDVIIRYVVNPEPTTAQSAEEPQLSNRLEIADTFSADLTGYSASGIQTVDVMMKYRVSDLNEKWYLEAYNWTSSAFSDTGFNSTSGQLPTAGWNDYAVNMTDQWSSYMNSNGTILLKILDENAEANQTTIDIDFIGVRINLDFVSFTLRNEGSFTAHVVALWVDNSTTHQRYDANLYVNAGDTATYARTDVKLPENPYTVKIVTERGNIATYSTS